MVKKDQLKPLSVRFNAMGSPCEVKIMTSDPNQKSYVLELAVKEVMRLHDKYSRYNANSVISKINQSAGNGELVSLDEETNAILNYADVCYQESNRLFDITSGVLRKVWDFKNIQHTATLPSQSQIDELLHLVGWEHVYWQDHQFALPKKNMEIDFGGIVKEYAADAVAALCQKEGIHSGLVDLGGDIRIIGPYPDNDFWTVFIQDPHKIQKYCKELRIYEGGVATSGVYERFLEIDGKRYSHLLNPQTGWPIEECVVSLTVLASQCIIAGSVSTIGMLKGRDCVSWLKEQIDLPFWCNLSNGDMVTHDSAH